LEIIDQVGREYDSDPITLGMIKTSIKHVFYHDDPIGFISSLIGSTLDSMTELQSVIGEDSYTDEKKIEFIKLFIAKFPDLSFSAKEYILQLGCELLKLGDPQGAIEVFSSSAAEELTSSPKFLFNKALALVELGGKDNYINAKYQLENLIKIVQTEVQNEIIDLNKVKVLLVTTLDKLGQYEEAIEHYKQISQAYQPEIVFEAFMLLKYSAFLASIEPRSMLKKEITDKVCALTKDEQIVRTLLEEAQDADFCYLIGMGYASQNNLLKANEHFKQAIDIFQGQSVLITAKSYVTYHMLCVGVMTRDPELVSKLLTKIDIDVDWLPPGYDCTPLYLAAEDLKTNIPEILLEKGANPFAICKLTELTPVHRAVKSLNHSMLEKVCTLGQKPEHSAEQSMDYQLGIVETLPYSEKMFLAKCLDNLGYETEFQTELLAESHNHNESF
ncbi:MAG: hypothetical protein WCG32_05900, partial [Actinomycetes bacterium]